jgi:hypothetical protein
MMGAAWAMMSDPTTEIQKRRVALESERDAAISELQDVQARLARVNARTKGRRRLDPRDFRHLQDQRVSLVGRIDGLTATIRHAKGQLRHLNLQIDALEAQAIAGEELDPWVLLWRLDRAYRYLASLYGEIPVESRPLLDAVRTALSRQERADEDG